MNLLTYILAGVRNRPGRNVAAAFCFAMIAANIFSGQYLIAGEVGSIGQGVDRMGADLLVVPLEYTRFLPGGEIDDTMAIVAVLPSTYRFGRTVVEEIGSVNGVVEASAQVFVGFFNNSDLSAMPIAVYGIEPETDFTIRPWLQNPPAHPVGTGEILIGHDLQGRVGETIRIAGRAFTVVGVLDRMQSEPDSAVFVVLEDAYALGSVEGVDRSRDVPISPGEVSAGLVRLAQGVDPEAVASDIRDLPSAAKVTIIERHVSLDSVAGNLEGLPGVLNAISAIVLVAAFPLVALISAMVANERRREIGLLRSMGAKRSTIVFLVISESLVLASLGAVAGIFAGGIVLVLLDAVGILDSALQVSFRIPGAAEIGVFAVLTLLVVIAMAALAALYPAYRSSTMNAFDAIRLNGR
jgi:putative ABC transport system permease protein